MEINVIQPSYYEKFQCTGPECRYTCCQEWSISLSKNEYTGIRNKIKEKELNALFTKSFKKLKTGRSNQKFASVNYGENSYCQLMDETGLCRLQLACGHKNLPIVCQIFPRKEDHILTDVERNLSLGCEAVVKLLLMEEQGIQFVSLKDQRKSTHPNGVISEQEADQRPVYRYIWDIKTLAASILQHREVSMDDRMLLLGFAMREIDKLELEHRENEIPQYVDHFLNDMENPEFLTAFSSIPANPSILLLNALHIFENISRSREIDRVTRQIQENLKLRKSNMGVESVAGEDSKQPNSYEITFSLAVDHAVYQEAEARMHQFLDGREYIIENVLVTWFFFNRFPFYEKKYSIWEHFIFFTCLYNLLKVALIGYLNEESDDLDLVHLITVFSRAMTHSPTLFEYLIDYTHKNESDSLAHMAIMIKS